MTIRKGIQGIIAGSREMLNRVKYRKYIPRMSNNLDLDLHIAEATAWLVRAQDYGSDCGVSYGAQFGSGFMASYPETTGYIVPTFLNLAGHYRDSQYLRRAIAMGDWEISVQMPSGAVMAGRVDNKEPQPAIFNTGQVLLGWSALLKKTGEERFRQAGIRAADWMLDNQEIEGNWIRGNSPYANQNATLYNVKAAWGLAEFGTVSDTPNYISAALRNAEFTLRFQHSNGWMDNCCLTDPNQPLLHTIAYTMQGLLGIGRLTGRRDFIAAVEKCAQSLLKLMNEEGFIPGCIDSQFRGAVSWCCLTGSAQTSIVWAELYQITGETHYRQGVERINRYLMSRHDISSPYLYIRGAMTGSWPVWGDYGQYMVLNWATKFFVDALLAQRKFLEYQPCRASATA
jgi:hypothetical protein